MKRASTLTGIMLSVLLCLKLTGQCPGTQTFTTDGTWTAPSTGGPWMVEITCNGAGGGNSPSNGRTGGKGAKTIGTFTVADGEVLNVIVGKKGNNGSTTNGGGAGGGSAVINCGNPGNCTSGTLLIAAAGGGGAGSAGNGGDGQGSQGNGDPGVCLSAGCGGGINSICPSGGACINAGTRGGQALLNTTSSGGTGNNGGGNGGNGFGGGGAGRFGVGGGGGGHSGGDSGTGSNGGGTGGESYNTGSNQTNTSGGGALATADGSVVINCLGVLPIEMKAFTVKSSGKSIQLSWQTSSESNNEGFEVQHSNDARQWQPLAFVTGHGTSNQPHFYGYTDEQPTFGTNYYRLKQIDFDGHFEYSPIVSADFRDLEDFGNLRFFPNPARQGVTSLYFSQAPETEGGLTIFGLLGNRVFYQKIKPEGDGQPVSVDLSNHPPGIYIARLELGGEVRTERLVIAK